LREVENVRRLWGKSKPRERREIIRGLARAVNLAAGKPPEAEWYTSEDRVRR